MSTGVYTIPLAGLAADSPGTDEPRLTGFPPPHEFVVGPENHLAAVAVESVIQSLAGGAAPKFNPLVLYGPPGCGKSHLALGVARCCREHFGRTSVVCLPAVEFAQALRDAMEIEAVDQWRSDVRRTRLLVIDDLHQLKDKACAQHELARTCDEMAAAGQQVLVTMQQHPAATAGLSRSLSGRLTGGLSLPLSLPQRECRRAFLALEATRRGVVFADDALAELADGLAVSVRELAGAVMHLQMASPGVVGREAVAEYVAGADRLRTPTLREITAKTARRFALRVADLRSHSRGRSLVTARGIAMLLARQTTDESLRQIGRYFGGRDHTTVLHACRRIEQLAATDVSIGQSLIELRRSLTRSEHP